MPDYERIDRVEKEIEYIQQVLLGNLKRIESLLTVYSELLKVYEDVILTFIKRDIEENGVREDD